MLILIALGQAAGAALNLFFYDQSHHWYSMVAAAICVVGCIYALLVAAK